MYDSFRTALGQKWALEILFLLEERGTSRYKTIENEFEASSQTITQRLSELAEFGLIEKEESSAREVRYSITENGDEIISMIRQINILLSG